MPMWHRLIFLLCDGMQGEKYVANKQYYEAINCFEEAADYVGAADKRILLYFVWGVQDFGANQTRGSIPPHRLRYFSEQIGIKYHRKTL